MSWYRTLTPLQKRQMRKALNKIHEHFGSYDKIARAIETETGIFISDETIRNWMLEEKLPVNYSATLSILVPDINFFHLVPWLKSHPQVKEKKQ